jgi:ankyrin repeat protein
MTVSNVTRQQQGLTDALSRQIADMYRLGGLALVFIFVGVASMFYGHTHKTALSGWIFAVGAVITLVCLGLFVYAQLSTPVKEARRTKKERAMAEALEEITLELAKATGAFQSLAFKHIGQADAVLRAARPFLAYLPQDIVPSDTENVAKVIVELEDKIGNLIAVTRSAVVQRDAAQLTIYIQDVKDVTRMLKRALGNPIASERLAEAVSHGTVKEVQLLVDEGADVDSLNPRFGDNPLMLAIREGHPATVRILLKAGANPDSKGGEKKTVLMLAAEKNQLEIVRELIDYDAAVDLADQNEMTALMHAAREGRAEVVRELIACGAAVNLADQNGMTALMRAAREGHPDVVRILIAAKAEEGSKDHNHMTALDHARRRHRDDIVEILTHEPIK